MSKTQLKCFLPKTQCSYRKESGTIDIIFVARQIFDKCREQHKDLHINFVNLQKAFDTVKYIAVLKSPHDNAEVCICSSRDTSDPFTIGIGVRQGCVIAPVIFDLFLAAVMKLARSYIPHDDGIESSYRLDGSVFNLKRLTARTRVATKTIVDLQYSDDAALMDCDPERLRHTLNAVTEAYNRTGLSVSTSKTEALNMQEAGDSLTFTCQNVNLTRVSYFKYLGSIMTSSCNLTCEVQRRVALASSSFGRLAGRVFLNRDLRISTKVAVYRAVCISVLLYGVETWVPYRKHLKILEQFHPKSLMKILGLIWWGRVSNSKIRRRAGIAPLGSILAQ